MSTCLSRLRELVEARVSNPEAAAKMEHSIALAQLGPEIVAHDSQVRPRAHPRHADLSPMAATEEFSEHLQRALNGFARRLGNKPLKSGQYNLLFAARQAFKEVWRARQIVDELGLPYDTYLRAAIEQRIEYGQQRMPRVTQLVKPDVIAYVIREWVDSQRSQ